MSIYSGSITRAQERVIADLEVILKKHGVHGSVTPTWYDNDYGGTSFQFAVDRTCSLKCEMSPYPSNCGIIVWHNLYLSSVFNMPRALKLDIIEFYKDLSVHMGYSQIQYTAQEEEQEDLISLLERAYFERIPEMTFINQRSDNTLVCLIYNI